MGWRAFTIVAAIGAALWSSAYLGLGYYFAGQISQVTDVLSSFFGLIIAGFVLIASGYGLIQKLREAKD